MTGSPPPRFATLRRDGLASLGGRVARLSGGFGRPFMPWQATASQLLNEVDDQGLRVHPFTVVTIQRQVGKTTWLLAEVVERCVFGLPNRRVWYTAQSGQYAREKWEELARELTGPGSPLRGKVTARYVNGAERLLFPNGSMFRPFPPTRDALHSMQSDLVIIDEGWRFDDVRGGELMQAIGPTQATRPGAQLVVASTAGTDDSTWLKSLVDRGRGGDPSVTYLEWGIGDHVDPMDLDEVAAAHPAVGRTIDRAFLEREAGILAASPGEFARAYGNRWTRRLERVIDQALWAAAATEEPLPSGPVTLAGDVAQDRSRAAIVACRNGVLEVVDSREGTEWIGPRMLELVQRWRPAAVVVDRAGPSGTLYDELARRKITMFPLTTADYATACARFVDDVAHHAVRYRRHQALNRAVDAAAQRNHGEGWAWARRTAGAPICELVAATLASWADQHRPAPPVKPFIFAG